MKVTLAFGEWLWVEEHKFKGENQTQEFVHVSTKSQMVIVQALHSRLSFHLV